MLAAHLPQNPKISNYADKMTQQPVLIVAEGAGSYGAKKDGEYYGKYCFRITE